MLTFDDVAETLEARIRAARLIAIDGLPCAGKTTLAVHLATRFGLPILAFDDFYRPEHTWPRDIAPSFPYPFIRVDEFRSAITALHAAGGCDYVPFDWTTRCLLADPMPLHPEGPLIVEGCSVLDPVLRPLYDLALFIESDAPSIIEARRFRDGGIDDEAAWRALFLPSVDLYMATQPSLRADVVVRGRGA
ncbi:uridine kinase family protein [Acidisphaera rubrifaciens]|uniref:uridine kinase family protein n=1 Tax=Acidisphaera rubrifaciens TaxID=50715 RepID=UPI0006629C89|nr:hypothetical protein [Acidisphaera rubrifaciens]